MTEVNNDVETTTAEAAASEGQVSLGINDLASVVQIIDVCSQRGAFQGSELEAVGSVRGRIQAFVKANAPAEENQTEESSADE